MKDKFTTRVSIKNIFIILGIIIGIFFILRFFVYEFSVIEIMAYFTGTITVITLIYHAIDLEARHKFREEDLKLRKHQYSYEVTSKINDVEMVKSLQLFHKIIENKAEYFGTNNEVKEEFLDYLKNDTNRCSMLLLLNYFEHISILVSNNHVEEKIIKDEFKTLFISLYFTINPYIKYRQKEPGRQRAWIEFENLSERWSKEK